MGYRDVLHYLEGVIVDRHELFLFDEEPIQNTSATFTAGLDDTIATVFDNGILLSDMDKDDYMYVSYDSVFRLDDRKTVEFYITPSIDITEGDLSLGFSDSPLFNFMQLAIDLPDIDKDTTELVSVDIPSPELLGSIRSVGLVCNSDLATNTIELSRVVAKNPAYVVTVEELDEFEAKDGVDFVLSKIGEDTMPTSSTLLTASYLAAGAYCWMYLNGQDTSSWDYGSKLATKNYAIRLLSDAEARCEEYLAGADTTRPKSVKLIGGYASLDI